MAHVSYAFKTCVVFYNMLTVSLCCLHDILRASPIWVRYVVCMTFLEHILYGYAILYLGPNFGFWDQN